VRNDNTSSSTAARTILVTGAGGEMGHTLLEALGASGPARPRIVAIDLRELDPHQRELCHESATMDVRDDAALGALMERHDFDVVFHLAAVLSTGGERNPALAHAVNVEGTWGLMQRLITQSERTGRATRFLLPSTIAVHGVPDLTTKAAAGAVQETQWCMPTTMYGCNKLYAEHLGRYLSTTYRALDQRTDAATQAPLDFRAIRFPGIISAETVPTGGTSDYGPEMLHAAAQGKPYDCFVREDAQIPFMTMPEAVDALLTLSEAPASALRQRVYGIRSFSATAGEIAERVREAFPTSSIAFKPHPARQAIVDSWPADMDDSAARRDWGWTPRWTFAEAFDEYLVPRICERYANG